MRAEGYRAVDLQPWQREIRAAEGLAPYPLLAVVTRSLHLDPAIADPLVEHGPVIIMTTQQHDEGDVRPLLAAGIEVRSHGRAAVDLAELTGDLAERGQSRILCEGGPRLHRDLLAAGLLDELSLTLSPSAVGGGGVRSTVGDPLPARVDFDLRFLLLAEDQTVFASYRRSTSPG
ncbi:MAG: dihydrofolate reductase family protein [Microlunatus sp.]|nr:dihydrofolate reductase family protein [Microlunatus sp.]